MAAVFLGVGVSKNCNTSHDLFEKLLLRKFSIFCSAFLWLLRRTRRDGGRVHGAPRGPVGGPQADPGPRRPPVYTRIVSIGVNRDS